MEFTYQMFVHQYEYENMVSQTGTYNGENTMTVNIDSQGFIVNDGDEFILQYDNPNHIILMDILNGSDWFGALDNQEQSESIGPYINLITEKVYAPSTVWDLDQTKIVNGVVEYGQFSTINEPTVKNTASVALKSYELNFDRTASSAMKAIYSKLITICEWILYEWDHTSIPAYKIIIPTVNTVDSFNDPS